MEHGKFVNYYYCYLIFIKSILYLDLRDYYNSFSKKSFKKRINIFLLLLLILLIISILIFFKRLMRLKLHVWCYKEGDSK